MMFSDRENGLMTATLAPRRPAAGGFVPVLAIITAGWAASIATLSYRGTFVAPPDKPQLAILVAVLLPPLLVFLLMRTSTTFRANVLALDPVWICSMQSWRVVGSGFLFVHGYGFLPGVFAYQAGWGDVLVGFLAPLVAVRLARDASFLTSWLYWSFHALGVADLVLAPVTATIIRRMSSDTDKAAQIASLADMPLVFVVTFLVPFFLCLHLVAFAQIRTSRAINRESSRP
jgi:hypothetical protein